MASISSTSSSAFHREQLSGSIRSSGFCSRRRGKRSKTRGSCPPAAGQRDRRVRRDVDQRVERPTPSSRHRCRRCHPSGSTENRVAASCVTRGAGRAGRGHRVPNPPADPSQSCRQCPRVGVAVNGYVPRRYDGRIEVMWAEAEPFDPRTWQMVGPDVRLTPVAGNHNTCVTTQVASLGGFPCPRAPRGAGIGCPAARRIAGPSPPAQIPAGIGTAGVRSRGGGVSTRPGGARCLAYQSAGSLSPALSVPSSAPGRRRVLWQALPRLLH